MLNPAGVVHILTIKDEKQSLIAQMKTTRREELKITHEVTEWNISTWGIKLSFAVIY